MQKRRSWPASTAKLFFFFFLASHSNTQSTSTELVPDTGNGVFPTFLFGNLPQPGRHGGFVAAASTGQPGQTGKVVTTVNSTQPTHSVPPASIVPSGQVGIQPPVPGVSPTSPNIVPPTTTTFIAPSATVRLFAVSSEVAGLVPVINSWKANPTSLKSDTLDKIKPVKNRVESLISNLGGHLSSGCGAKRKRSLLSKLDVLDRLSCIDDGLGSITDHINGGDIDAIDDSLNSLKTQNSDLTDNEDEDDDSSKTSNDEASSTGTSSILSSLSPTLSSSCVTSATALHVTVQCAPTSISAGGSFIPTTTCSPVTTVTTGGCSVTGLTTTVATGTSASLTQIPCASDTCGKACPKNGGPLSGASMAMLATTGSCASISTIATSALPTASYGVFLTANIATPTPESSVTGLSKRNFLGDSNGDDKTLVDRSIARRHLPEVTPPYTAYVEKLRPTWIDQDGYASAQWFNYPAQGHHAAGVKGIYGCTSVIICSEKGVYISHIWEDPVFITGNYIPTDDNFFTVNAFNALRDGTATAQSITALVGSDQDPGPLNAIYVPKVFVLTPFTTDDDRTLLSVTTTLRYPERAEWLAQQVAKIIPGSDIGAVMGYTRTGRQVSTREPGTAGRAILEVDPLQYVYIAENSPPGAKGLQVGAWRLWVEDQLITYQEFWLPHAATPGGIQGRDINLCGSNTLSASITSPPVSSTLATVAATSWDPTDCQAVENPRYYLSAMVCSCNNGHTYTTMTSNGIDGPCGFTTPPASPLSTMPIVTPSPTPEDPAIIPPATVTGLPSTTASKWPVPSWGSMEICANPEHTDQNSVSNIFTCYGNSTLFRIFAPAGTPYENGVADNDEQGFGTWEGGGCACLGGEFCCDGGSRVPVAFDDGNFDGIDTDGAVPSNVATAIDYFNILKGACSCNGDTTGSSKRHLDVVEKDKRRGMISSRGFR